MTDLISRSTKSELRLNAQQDRRLREGWVSALKRLMIINY